MKVVHITKEANTNPSLSLTAPKGTGAIDQEIEKLQASLTHLPKEVDLWGELGSAWVKKARESQDERLYTHALDAAKTALAYDPEHPAALRVKALVLQNEHDFLALHDLAKEMIQKDPKHPEAWALLGDAQLELGRYQDAEKSYQILLDLHPSLPAFARSAYLRWLYGDIEGSLEMWEDAVKVGFRQNPEQIAYCLTEKGHVYWHMGDLENASSHYQRALILVPEYAGALFGTGRILFAKQDQKGAFKIFQRATQIRPTVEILSWLVHTAKILGEEAIVNKAEKNLETLGRKGDFRSLSLYYSTQNTKVQTAIHLAKKDIAQRGGVYAHDVLAFAFLRAKNYREAKLAMQKALSLGTQDPLLFAHAGLIEKALGNLKAANVYFEQARSLNPYFDPVLVKEIIR